MNEKLAPKQLEKFRTLYAEGYSAFMLFKELGYDYSSNIGAANNRMRYYREKFGLPKRGINFKPSVSRGSNPELRAKKLREKRQKRIKQLRKIINNELSYVRELKRELSRLLTSQKNSR